jgi:O-antigen ligase
MMLTLNGGKTIADSSTYGRSLLKVLAWKMFAQKPWLGYGIDGFTACFGM